MAENPFESGQTQTSAAAQTRATRWLIWLGVGLFALGVVSVYVVIRGVYERIAGASIQPKPAELADSITRVQLAHWLVLPLLVLGVLCIVAGFLVRRPLPPNKPAG